MTSSIEALAQSWLELDQNDATRDEIKTLVQNGDTKELENRLRNRIEFGTAGLRGRMEAGFARMNDLIIIQASQGLSQYVLNKVSNAQERGVVIGHDHRHNSELWAHLTAAVFLEAGFKVYLHRGLVHTPIVPFSIKKLQAAAGVMITASHNPKQDNGYKVYWENAVQIISPHDTGMASAIELNSRPNFSIPWKEAARNVFNSPKLLDKTVEMYEDYYSLLKGMITPLPSDTILKFVTTPMHGVGHIPVMRALEAIKLPESCVSVVPEQKNPDPEFPTVAFPNPEEHGALKLAVQLADSENATYVLAQDPDADRFSAAQKRPDGTWHQFSGDQLGSLFAARALTKYKKSVKPLDKLAMVASTVSSKMIESMAQIEHFRFVECLTGFKYIGNTALGLIDQGFDVPFGYEEAIGFMIENGIRDKDGVSATVAFVELVVELHARGSDALQYLNQLYERYGYFQTRNSYFICTDPPTIDRIFARLRNYPRDAAPVDRDTEKLRDSPLGARYPSSIGSLAITSIRDLTSGYGYDSSLPPNFIPELPLSGGHMITIRAGRLSQDKVTITLTIRTSGTEPKIKYYLEGQGSDRGLIETTLHKIVEELRGNWMEAQHNGLLEP